jgi:hypothetical protein
MRQQLKNKMRIKTTKNRFVGNRNYLDNKKYGILKNRAPTIISSKGD